MLMLMSTLPISVKGVLIRQGRVLLLLNERGEWDLPGGRPDPGEDHRTALKREVQEETGLVVEVGAALGDYLFEVLPGRFVRILPFVCRLTGGGDVVLEPRASGDALAADCRARRAHPRPSSAGRLSRRDPPGDRPAAVVARATV